MLFFADWEEHNIYGGDALFHKVSPERWKYSGVEIVYG